jgi:(S)-mandelate dehydrogenase
VNWKTLERVREAWKGNLVIKGILHPEDARLAADLGVEAIIVSNHGGRQLDAAPSPLDMLPSIRAAVPDMTLMLDSGVRRGSDIIIAMCLGARFAFFGRPTLYGAAAAAAKGIDKALAIVRAEVDAVMAQIGCNRLDELNPSYLRHAGATVADFSAMATPKPEPEPQGKSIFKNPFRRQA